MWNPKNQNKWTNKTEADSLIQGTDRVFSAGWTDDGNRGIRRVNLQLHSNSQFQNKSQGCKVHIGNTVNNKVKYCMLIIILKILIPLPVSNHSSFQIPVYLFSGVTVWL